MPSTWSAPTRLGAPSRPGVRSETTQRSLVVGARRAGSRGGRPPRRRSARAGRRCRAGRPGPGSAASAASCGDRRLQQEQPGQGGQRAARRRTPQARRGLVAAQRAVRRLAQRLGDAVVGEVRRRRGRRAGGRRSRGSCARSPLVVAGHGCARAPLVEGAAVDAVAQLELVAVVLRAAPIARATASSASTSYGTRTNGDRPRRRLLALLELALEDAVHRRRVAHAVADAAGVEAWCARRAGTRRAGRACRRTRPRRASGRRRSPRCW